MQYRAPNNNNIGNFAVPQNNVSANLHIPPSRQRSLQPGESPVATGSPMRPPAPMQPMQSQAAAIQRMLSQGIPVSANAQNGNQQQMMGLQQIAGQDIKPYMLLQQMKAQAGQNGDPSVMRPGQIRQLSDHSVQPTDRSGSLLSRVSWTPSSEHDTSLKEKLSGFQRSIRPTGRSTLAQGLGVSRVLGDVLVERMPEGLRAIADEAESGMMGEDGEGKGKEVEGSGLPGQKKRKVSEVAETVDRTLDIDSEVETVSHPGSDEETCADLCLVVFTTCR